MTIRLILIHILIFAPSLVVANDNLTKVRVAHLATELSRLMEFVDTMQKDQSGHRGEGPIIHYEILKKDLKTIRQGVVEIYQNITRHPTNNITVKGHYQTCVCGKDQKGK